MDGLRVFISYAHEDQALAARVAAHLESHGVIALWAKNLHFGQGFVDEIKTFISYAHVFLPIITRAASARGWVHQEIGYASAMNVPVLPITVGELPPGMLQGLHAVTLDSDSQNLDDRLRPADIERASRGRDSQCRTLYCCAEEAEERAEMMRKYSDEVAQIGYAGVVRQDGGLSSFHIPDRAPTSRVFQERYGNRPKGIYHAKLQRAERNALEYHARAEGCRLIVYPGLEFREWGAKARIIRLKCLLEFLQAMPDEKVEIANGTGQNAPERSASSQGENITILGNWFSAVSISGQMVRGFRQTIFTRHAPTVGMQVERFDETFRQALKMQPWPDASSTRMGAILFLEQLVLQLEHQLGETVSIE